ncbi:MAG TPA: sulfatase/phosphatase domain-containing protein [Draconibacterium sp.]|nr:sulfatase/phosphatase domain-containing protein [Draconibacterium sp.]
MNALKAELTRYHDVKFNSLFPAISEQRKISPYPKIYVAYINLHRMVRTGKYKLIIYPWAKKLLLFDVQTDPDEMIDLSEKPKYANVINDLIGKFKEQQNIMNDPLDLHPYVPDLF